MTARVRFRPQAAVEIEEARDWYEAQVPGLGVQFVAAVDDALERIAERPLTSPRVLRDVRRRVLARFPYAIYFRPAGDAVLVLAVVHGHRHPRVWRGRR